MSATFANLAEVKRLFYARQLKGCLAECEAELSAQPNTLPVAHKLYFHFFLASTYDNMARSTNNHSPDRPGWLIEAKIHYAHAIDLAVSLKPVRRQCVAESDSDCTDNIAWLEEDVNAHIDGLVAQLHTHVTYLEAFRAKVAGTAEERVGEGLKTAMVLEDETFGSGRHERQYTRFCPRRYIELAQAATDELMY